MITAEHRQKFLDKLEDLPIVSVVCRHVGISKATIYRWRDEDPKFKKRYDRAMKLGRESIVDHAESKLLKLVDKENLGAIKMVLEANSKRYYRPRRPMKAPSLVEPIPGIRIQILDRDDKDYDRKSAEIDKHNQDVRKWRMRNAEMGSDEEILPSL